MSYSLYTPRLQAYFAREGGPDWAAQCREAMAILQKEEELQEVVQLVGFDAIPDADRIALETSKLIREAFLAQNAFHEVDAFCPLPKQYWMLNLLLHYHRAVQRALADGVPLELLLALKIREELTRAKELANEGFAEATRGLKEAVEQALEEARISAREQKAC
jgi:V/A-type H+-transporting ATPase subunit A